MKNKLKRLYAKEKAEPIERGLPGQEAMGARLITATVGDLSFTTIYCPNGKSVDHDDYPKKLAWFESLRAHLDDAHDSDEPAVLCGDFNAAPGLPTCRAIGQRLTDVQIGLDGHRPRRTWGGRWPVARIDHIFVDPAIQILHVDVPATHLTQTASDHLPLFADLRAGAAATGAS